MQSRVTAIARALKLSSPLSQFMKKQQASRPEIVKAIYAYAKENKLQKEENKRFIKIDPTLKSLFPSQSEVDLGGIMKGIKDHVTDENPKKERSPRKTSPDGSKKSPGRPKKTQ